MQTFQFEAVHNSMLTPILAAVAIDNVLTTLEKRSGERTLVWKSSIQTPARDVRWDSVFSGLQAREEAVTSLALLANYLMANEFRDLPILGVDVEITHSDRLQNGRIVNVEAAQGEVPRGRARAGAGGHRRLPRRLAAPHARPRRSRRTRPRAR